MGVSPGARTAVVSRLMAPTSRWSPWWRHPATARRRCWPNGSSGADRGWPGCRATAPTTTRSPVDGHPRRPRPDRAGRRERDALTASGGGVDVVPRLVERTQRVARPVLVVLDHVEEITSPESRTSIAEFASPVPAGWRLAVASRDAVPLPRRGCGSTAGSSRSASTTSPWTAPKPPRYCRGRRRGVRRRRSTSLVGRPRAGRPVSTWPPWRSSRRRRRPALHRRRPAGRRLPAVRAAGALCPARRRRSSSVRRSSTG